MAIGFDLDARRHEYVRGVDRRAFELDRLAIVLDGT